MHGEMDCDDWRFISEISSRFPGRNILENFRAFTDMPAHLRPRLAAFRTNFVDREGWNQIGVRPRVQSLHNHVETLLDMLRHLSPEGTDIARLSEMIEIHDLQEVITSDFTWDDPVTKAEKIRIERLAINIIFENNPAKIALWEEYAAKRSADAQWINDLDKLENIYEAEVLELKYPSLRAVFRQWNNSVGDILKTGRGAKAFDYLIETVKTGLAFGNKHDRIVETGRFLRQTLS